MVAGEIDARAWHECCESGEKFLGAEQDMGGAVAERVLERVYDVAVGIG